MIDTIWDDDTSQDVGGCYSLDLRIRNPKHHMVLRPTELLNLRRHDLRSLRFTTLMRYGVTSYGFMIHDFAILRRYD